MRIILSILILLTGSTIVAQSSMMDEFIEQMKTVNAEVSSISSDFTQTQEMAIFANNEISKGRFYYMKDDRMKWEQKEPTSNYFVFNGDDAYLYDGKQKEKISAKNPRISTFKKFIMGTIDGSVFSDESFDNKISQQDHLIIIEMAPLKKALKKRFEKIILTFDSKKMILLELVFLESNNDKRTIHFYNHELNTLSDPTIFN